MLVLGETRPTGFCSRRFLQVSSLQASNTRVELMLAQLVTNLGGGGSAGSGALRRVPSRTSLAVTQQASNTRRRQSRLLAPDPVSRSERRASRAYGAGSGGVGTTLAFGDTPVGNEIEEEDSASEV